MPDADVVLEQWLAEQFQEYPVLATDLGIEGHDDRLGDFSAPAFERRSAADRRWARELVQLATSGVERDQQIDIDLVSSELAGRAVLDDWGAWRRDPETYLGPCLEGVFGLFLHRLHPEPELARCAIARLGDVAQVLEEAKANLDPSLANRMIVERSLGSCQAGITYARDLVPAEVADPVLRQRIAEAGEEAADALGDFAAFLSDLADKAQGSWALGETNYSRLLRSKELLGYGCLEMQARGQAAWAALDTEMEELSARIDPDAGGWRALVRSLAADAPRRLEDMREAYERSTRAARQFLIDHDLVTLPEGERCLVEPSPIFQRPLLAVASYMSPPPFSTSSTGHFFVPYPPEGTSAKEVAELLSDNNFHNIPTTAVHEAYPGHHWHLTWIRSGRRRVRKAIWSAYFLEGWALYAETMMRQQGFFADARQELCHLDARIFRAARIIVDTSLHTGEMSIEEAVEVMSTKASLGPAVARAEVARYCAWPTQAASYLTGSLEIERIRDRYLGEGRGDLKSFHDAIAGSGAMPIALAERAVFG